MGITDTSGRFQVLYEQHHADLLAYFLRRLDRQDAIDATADVFLTAWRRIEDAPDGAEARLWLYGVARNTLRNQQRSSRRLTRLVAKAAGTRNETEPPPEDLVLRRKQDGDLIEALGRLRPNDIEVLRLRLWEEETYDDIADLFHCSRHAAEQRYSKALARLRRVCREAGHEWATETKGRQPQEQAHE
ncbi:MAG: sigma-70 family RNA polymerase sigma factor, partial [Acidimicrobiia bacterium]|nr:sigma-70 family RNA polymerase sigma factor [Acidimicrobiia bacterium]